MDKPDEIIRFSVSLPRTLLEHLDREVIGKGYASRSEFVRDFIRERMVEESWASGEEQVAGVLTIIYDHHQRGLSQQIIDIQHHDKAEVLCATHVHLDHNNCLETIIIRGRPADVEQVAIEIGGLKGVRFSRLTRASKIHI